MFYPIFVESIQKLFLKLTIYLLSKLEMEVVENLKQYYCSYKLQLWL